MKLKDSKGRLEPTPLAKSAAAAALWRGLGASPATTWARSLTQAVAGPGAPKAPSTKTSSAP
jgi:hypothetical protein